jgi:hypothetical protein
MQLAKSIMLKSPALSFPRTFFPVLFVLFSFCAFAQSNSPYSRYGLGDLAPGTSINTRGMGGISAAYADLVSVNFSNPASYSQFQTFIEKRSKKVSSGRVILDVGMNFDNRTLIAPNTPNSFTSSDAVFSYLQVGMPIRKNWGLSFGIRPLTRIGYSIDRNERLVDPVTLQNIDSVITQFRGSGGSYLPTIGTGFGTDPAKKNSVSLGFNVGYLFGSRENTALRSFINDTVLYYSSDHTNNASFGGLFFDAGLQYQVNLKKNVVLRFGVSGNWKQTLNGAQDVLRQTYTLGSAGEELQIDSVFQQNDIKGKVVYPASYKAGFVAQRNNSNGSGWLFGADYTQNKWSGYRFFGQTDSVQDNWMINIGGQFFPRPKSNYFSRVAYRFGFFTGPDYVKLENKLPQFGVSFGMGLPIPNYQRLSNQFTMINLALEYGKRGNNDNLLKENLFRVSLGLNLSDFWFNKKKYE